MSLKGDVTSLFSGFSKLTRQERFQRLLELGALNDSDLSYLRSGGIRDNDLAEKLIENVIGYFQLPLGVATNFLIDGKDYVIPLAVEETSIVAALSKSAKWIREHGDITTKVEGACVIGQIQIAKVSDVDRLKTVFEENKTFFIEIANKEVAQTMVRRGGGVRDLTLRWLERQDSSQMAVIHLAMDCCDAMGANILNQVLEFLKTPIEQLTGETVTMCILSNLNDQKLTTAEVTIKGVPPELGQRIEEASTFAELDAYRAATHNKGVMNGIDPLLIATGNDWRAVEAGIHAYASRSGQYQPISQWRYEAGCLLGSLTAPIIVGTIGGVTALHPTAKMCLNMLGVESANELSRVIAAVGLVQNLGALRALSTEGIIQGHMRLHLDNLALVAGATEAEAPLLKYKLKQCLDDNKRISVHNACSLLAEMRELSQAVP